MRFDDECDESPLGRFGPVCVCLERVADRWRPRPHLSENPSVLHGVQRQNRGGAKGSWKYTGLYFRRAPTSM